MVTDLLSLAQVQAGQLALHPAQHDLQAIVRAAVDEQRQLWPSRDIRLHLPARLAVQAVPVWADADRIHQVVTNLLTNALKYAPADWPVDVQVRMHAGWARVSVRDQGPGLPAEEHERIWEPFHRAEGIPDMGAAVQGNDQSLGLGLYICKLIIEQHQGKMSVTSVQGRGSTFWFALPMVRTERGAEQPSEQYSA
jgi:signal transduction histidine kinase